MTFTQTHTYIWHRKKGEDSVEYFLGLTPSGIVVLRNKTTVAHYFWPRIAKVYFKGRYFMLRVCDKNVSFYFLDIYLFYYFAIKPTAISSVMFASYTRDCQVLLMLFNYKVFNSNLHFDVRCTLVHYIRNS